MTRGLISGLCRGVVFMYSWDWLDHDDNMMSCWLTRGHIYREKWTNTSGHCLFQALRNWNSERFLSLGFEECNSAFAEEYIFLSFVIILG